MNRVLAWVCAVEVGVACSVIAGWMDDIGLTALRNELGGAMPTGAGITVSQIEAPFVTNYIPDPNNSELLGKSFNLKSGPSGVSGHATTVARNFYGTSTGVAPGVSTIDCYEAANFLTTGFLQTGNNTKPPSVETRRIQNHSWVGEWSYAQEAVRRFDYAILRDRFVAVVGLNNFSTNVVPGLMAHTYNGITVGQSTGDHSRGGTRFDEPGRLKPDLVSPSAFGGVSHSVAVVSGAAALLLQTADGNPALANARNNPEVIKAVLMAGATKSEFPTWTRTHTQPLDPVYGAGELNIYNSYHILVAGEQVPGTAITVSTTGWDFNSLSTSPALYFFEITEGNRLVDFSMALTWNRYVYDSDPRPQYYSFAASVANLRLELYAATNFTLGSLLDWSDSSVDNVEHIYAAELTQGQYAILVTGDTAGQAYALAWRGALVPEPTSWLILGLGGLLMASLRRVTTRNK